MTEQVLKTYLDENGLLHTSLHGVVHDDKLDQLKADIAAGHTIAQDEFKKRNAKLRGIIDFTDFSGDFTPHALPIMAEYMRANKPFMEKSAGFGAGKTTTLAANVITALGGRSDISFFATKEEALAWLLTD